MFSFQTYYQSPLGWLKICCNDDAITSFTFEDTVSELESSHELLEKCKAELEQYFSGTLQSFSIKIAS